MKRAYFFMVIMLCLTGGWFSPKSSAAIGYFSESIMRLQESAQMASRSENLQDIRQHAQDIMVIANEFQQQAQDANDAGFVNEAIDMYNSAYRAVQSTTVEEARGYARQLVSHAEIVAQQTGISIHDPFPEPAADPQDVKDGLEDYFRYYRDVQGF